MRRSPLDRFREALRLQRIYNTLSRYGADFLLDRGALGAFRRRLQTLIYRPSAPLVPLSPPAKARLLLQELGPTYVKMGQIVSSQTNVLPDDWHAEMSKLQSSVAPFPYERASELITEELGAPPEELYARFSPTPLAAASLAQVHEATLEGGERVAVKVQRPDAARQIRADVGILKAGSGRFEKQARWAREIGLAGMIDEFSQNLFNELDYYAEAYNAVRLTDILDPIPGVSVPQVHRDLSASRVLTLEFVEGVKISDVEAIDAAGFDRADVAERAVRAAVKMLLIDGFFHADPHPGNVLVNLESGRITFLDTGMVGEINLRQRFNLINLLVVGQQRDVTALAQTLLSLSEPFRKTVDERAFYRNFERKISRYMDPRTTPQFAEAINASFDLLRDHGFRLDPQLTLAIKALMQASAITTTLRPAEGKSFFELGLDVTYELLDENVTADRIAEAAKNQLAFAGRELIRQLPTFQSATGKWLEQYQKGRLEVYLDTSGLEQQMKTGRWITRMITIAVVLSGMVIGSAIAASVGSEVFDWLPDFALSVYISAIAVAAILVILLLWRLIRGEREED